ncbi:probable disease resistance protein RF9 [Salvia hispanica]|uniref:probable disease resistance protein RF9 n=1 Tax=Salvia hispanica TaxID=49212 RepID=UPI0020098B63|nr:probable disease resistance protein RF9 [Salvia hispanica]
MPFFFSGVVENLGSIPIAPMWRKIRSLRHLYMSDVVCSEPLKLDIWKLISLAFVSIYDYAFENLGWMRKTGLNLLGIEDIDENANVSKLVASLKKGDINHCSCLALRGFHFRCMPCLDEIGKIYMLPTLKLNRRLARLPKTQGGLYRVSDLVLVNTCLDEDPMPLLEELPKLKRLKLRNAYTGQEMVIKNNGFPKLCVLNINELWNLRNILVGEGVMPKLEQLEIKNCPHLETLPKEIGSMKCLRKFKMLTTRHIATKIKNSGLISKILEVDIGPLSSMA